MNKFKYIMFSLLLFMFAICNIKAEENLVNLYLFYSKTCPHCEEEIKMLDSIKDDYKNLRIYKYELSEDNNSEIFRNVATLFDLNISGVPFTIVGEKTFIGYGENSKKTIIGAIDYYSKHGYVDKVGEYLNKELPSYEIKEEDISIDEYLEDYGNYSFNIPIIGEVNTKSLTIPMIAVVMGFIDGFNPCAMWILLFLITMLISMNDRKKMWILGCAFLITSALIYFLIMLAWLNVAVLITKVNIIRAIIGFVAIIGGLYNIITTFKTSENGCNATDKKDRKKIIERIKKFTSEKSIWLSLVGVIALAISVNLIELACSAGLPVMFTQILVINDLSKVEYFVYILVYIFFFLIDDLLIFIIAISTMKVSGISVKYGKISKIVGGVILLLIGLLLLLKPEWLMLNF